MTRKSVLASVFAVFAALGAAAMPTKAQFQKVLPLVKELSAEDNAAVKAGTLTPKEAGDRALERAGDTSLDEASRYLFFEAAFAYYVSATEYDKAAEVVGKLRAEIKDVPDAAVIEFIERRLRKVKREHAGQLYELLQDARTRSQIGAKIATYQKTVKANPGDTISQARLAYCQVLVRNWDEALKAFAKSDGEVAKMAQAELAGKGKSAVSLGDFWWGFTINDYNFRNYAEQLAEEFKAHAATHYRKALAGGELKGVKRQLVSKRIGDVGTEEPDTVNGRGRPLSQGGDDAAKNVAGASSAAKPSSVKQLPSKTFDLGKGVKMEFIECSAGTFMMGAEPSLWKFEKLMIEFQKDNTHFLYPHKVKITRPFWMSKYPVTFADFDAVVGGKKYKIAQTAFGDRAIVKYDWEDAENFTARLTGKLRSKLPKGYVVRLPTEAEFEYAQRCGDGDASDLHRQVFERPLRKEEMIGMVCDSGKNLIELMLKNGCSDAKQFLDEKRLNDPYVKYKDNLILFGPAGRYKPNDWGLHDMFLGTVCLDRFGKNSDGKFPYEGPLIPLYKDEESDPLLFKFLPTDKDYNNFRYMIYRPFWSCIPQRANMKNCGWIGEPVAFRIVIGPDLMKEKGFDKK